ncbi:MAG: Uncharacterised protein [Prochlorococcus marinus str. MIT 9313]|nr:MAG: Uncharacterised protein [Prochlorococcus marinus str. MIT 9313]
MAEGDSRFPSIGYTPRLQRHPVGRDLALPRLVLAGLRRDQDCIGVRFQ